MHSGKKHVFKHRIKQQVTETHIAYLPTPRRKQEIQISAKRRKLLLFGVDIDSSNETKLFSDVLCPTCKVPGIQFTQKPEDNLGFAARIVVECTNCTGYISERTILHNGLESWVARKMPHLI